MRITGGKYRGRKLQPPADDRIRPASDMVRQAVFNMLLSRGLPERARVLDLFCGTGAYGLEALSRGASSCVFIDNGAEAVTLCRRNIAQTGAEGESLVLRHDVSSLAQVAGLPAGRKDMLPADLVFLDPPYRQNLLPAALSVLRGVEWATPGALFVIEMARDEPAAQLSGLTVEADRQYGVSRILLARF